MSTDAPPLIPTAALPAVQSRPANKASAPAGLHPDTVTVSIAEACKILGLGRTKVNELIKTDLKIKRMGRRVQIFAQSIRDYLERP